MQSKAPASFWLSWKNEAIEFPLFRPSSPDVFDRFLNIQLPRARTGPHLEFGIVTVSEVPGPGSRTGIHATDLMLFQAVEHDL